MKKCSTSDISLKSNFLGPQAENANFLQVAFVEILSQYFDWRKSLFPKDGAAISFADQQNPLFLENQKNLRQLTNNLSTLLQKEIPQFSPRYLGHMFSELSLPGLLGHVAALLHNPNNISKESSHVGLQIEADAIKTLYKIAISFHKNDPVVEYFLNYHCVGDVVDPVPAPLLIGKKINEKIDKTPYVLI